MNSKDLHDDATVLMVRPPAALGTTAAGYDGTIIDRQAHQGGAIEFVVLYGTRTTTTISAAVIVKEGSVTGTLTSVADGDLLGTEADAGLAASATMVAGTSKDVCKKIGYIGSKRYVTVNLKAASAASMVTGAAAVVSALRKAPPA